jgi:hypothetical protein
MWQTLKLGDVRLSVRARPWTKTVWFAVCLEPSYLVRRRRSASFRGGRWTDESADDANTPICPSMIQPSWDTGHGISGVGLGCTTLAGVDWSNDQTRGLLEPQDTIF